MVRAVRKIAEALSAAHLARPHDYCLRVNPYVLGHCAARIPAFENAVSQDLAGEGGIVGIGIFALANGAGLLMLPDK